MTRKEIRNNEATNYGYAVAGGCIERGYIQDAFERGAEWADAHPVNTWHKVADGDLPEDGQHILYAQKIPYGFYYGVIYYPEPFITDDMDYWMEIPEIKED